MTDTTKIRARLVKSKWALPTYRARELYYYCLQYPEWIAEYNGMLGARAVSYGSGGAGSSPGHPTEAAGIRRAALKEKIDLVEETAREADEQLASYILLSVTRDYVSYDYMVSRYEMPCSRGTYYDRRRRFYWLLDQKMK